MARAAQRKVMSISLAPGSRLPAYCTSMGRVLLAALPEADATLRIFSMAMPARTAHTITAPKALMEELTRVRAQGYAVIEQEVEIGLRSIAVPLHDARGKVIAALNIGLPAVAGATDDLATCYLPALKKVQIEIAGIVV